MRVEKFRSNESNKISNLILKNYPSIKYSQIMKLLRNKDIKVNGKRISKDEIVAANSEIQFYINDEVIEIKLDIIYEDDNILVVFKPRKLEVENNTENCVVSLLSKQIGVKCYAVHRLDMNTTGLLILAKNSKAKESLDRAFKHRTIEKYYLAILQNVPTIQKGELVAYLRKDNNKSLVEIVDLPKNGFEKIITKYNVIRKNERLSLVEVELVTGKTHQIRAHFAHIGCPILGDEKYGNSNINREYKVRYQCLCAYKIAFSFNEDDYLSYLNSSIIRLDDSKIDFLKIL